MEDATLLKRDLRKWLKFEQQNWNWERRTFASAGVDIGREMF
jgi:hypothetical protein